MIEYSKIFSVENKLMDTLQDILDEMGKKDCSPSIKFSSDYHLFRELRDSYVKSGFCPGAFPQNRTKSIIEVHNKFVKPTDVFVYLGDCVDDQLINDKHDDYSIDTKSYLKQAEDIFKNQLNGKIKIIILGNNDILPEKTYISDFGFNYVLKGPIKTGIHVFSHKPIDIPKNMMNIHGHLHYGTTYWDVDWHRHMRPTIDLMKHPVTMKELYLAFAKGKFNAETIKH